MLITLGINHQTAPVAVRERISFPGERLRDSLAQLQLAIKPAAQEIAILSTCNRTEIYIATQDPDRIRHEVPAWMAQQGMLAAEQLRPHLYVLNQSESVRHAFRVASGLDSMVLGEPQILGQMKDAVRAADEAGCLGTNLHALFQRTFAVAKEVRTGTEIGLHSVSMAAAAVKLARRIFDDLTTNSVLFIGAGEMIELCATHFAAQRPRRMVVANRTVDRAVALAEKIGAGTLTLREVPDQLDKFDIVISCTASTLPILGLGMVERASKARRHRPMFMVDLAVPRDIEEEVGRLDDVFLYTVDDLGAVVRQGNEQRQQAVAQANEIITDQVQGFMRWLDARAAVPLIQEMRAQGEALRLAELELARKRLAKGVDPQQVLEQLSQGLTHKFLHGPLSMLHSAEGDERAQLHDLLPRLFATRQAPIVRASDDVGSPRAASDADAHGDQAGSTNPKGDQHPLRRPDSQPDQRRPGGRPI